MKPKQMMVSAAMAGALVAPAAQAVEMGGLSLDKPAVFGERLAVKKTTKKVAAKCNTCKQKQSRILEVEALLKGERVAVKRTTKKFRVS
jgi:hypothetical protein